MQRSENRIARVHYLGSRWTRRVKRYIQLGRVRKCEIRWREVSPITAGTDLRFTSTLLRRNGYSVAHWSTPRSIEEDSKNVARTGVFCPSAAARHRWSNLAQDRSAQSLS